MENEKIVKWVLASLLSVSAIGGFFYHENKSFSDKETRSYKLEDRKFYMEQKSAALVRLHSCYEEASLSYESNWAKACKSVNNHNIDACINSSVPENTCRTKFIYQSDCELPGGRADNVNQYLKDAKNECLLMYKLEISIGESQ